MEVSSDSKRSTHVITVQPNETTLVAFPYGPHSSLLDFLKGEPRVLGAVQVLLAFVIVGIGTVFAFNYFSYSQSFPLVFFTGYPFWGALIFIVTGYLTGFSRKTKCLGLGVMAMNVISSLAAVTGITLTIISFQDQHEFCEMPSPEGICVIGRVLFNGILSVLLIINMVELSISVTIASFRSKCWTKSNEIVFFLPLDVAQDSELSIPGENAIIQFDFQEDSSSDDPTTKAQPVFFGGYTFFKLRVSKSPLTFHHAGRRDSINNCMLSLSGSDEQKNTITPSLKHYEEEVELKPLFQVLEKTHSGDIKHTEQINDEDLQFAIEQQTQSLQAKALPQHVVPFYDVKKLEALPPRDLSEDMPSQDITSQDTQSLDISSQDTPYQGMLSQVQDLPTQAMQSEAQTFHAVKALDIQHLEQQSLDLQLQKIQHEDQQLTHTSYQDIQSEVNLLTQEWKYEKHQSRKSLKQHSFDQHSRIWQSSKKKSIDLSIQSRKSSRKKSLDQPITGSFSLKRHSIDKQSQVKQVSDQQAEDQLKQQSQNRQGEDQQAQEEKPPKQLVQHLQTKIQKYQDCQSLSQQFQEWRAEDWKNKEGQFEMKHSLNWESRARQTQELLEEFLRRKVLYKEAQTLHAKPQNHLDQQFPDSQYQDKNQKDLQSTGVQKENIQINTTQTKDVKLTDMKSLWRNPSDLHSEDMKPDLQLSSCQSSAQGASSTYLSIVGSERDVQQNTSISSTSYKEDPALSSCYSKDQQQSEDSD